MENKKSLAELQKMRKNPSLPESAKKRLDELIAEAKKAPVKTAKKSVAPKKEEPKKAEKPTKKATSKKKESDKSKANKERLKAVMAKAKSIRKPNESWKDAVKRASAKEQPKKKVIKRTTKPVAKMKVIKRTAKPVPKKKKVIVKKDRLTGTSITIKDQPLKAMKAGKRISKSGNTYYEYRRNRADADRRKKL